mgnify:CR=1 FL=1
MQSLSRRFAATFYRNFVDGTAAKAVYWTYKLTGLHD